MYPCTSGPALLQRLLSSSCSHHPVKLFASATWGCTCSICVVPWYGLAICCRRQLLVIDCGQIRNVLQSISWCCTPLQRRGQSLPGCGTHVKHCSSPSHWRLPHTAVFLVCAAEFGLARGVAAAHRDNVQSERNCLPSLLTQSLGF